MKLALRSVKINNKNKIFNRIFDAETKKYANTRLHAYCSPYVPMNTGYLDQTVDITTEYVHYKAPYAHKIWTGEDMKFSRDKHPLATARWERAMVISKGQQLANDISNYKKRK